MARKRTPSKSKILKGTFRKDRAPARGPDPDPVPAPPKPPRYLGRPGKALWRKVAKMLQEQGILTPLDLPALEVFCSIYETWRGAQEAVFARVEDPETGRTRRRTMTEYAAGRGPHDRIEASVMRECWQAFRLWCSEFGLTPSARSGLELPAPEAKEEDIIEKMFRESEQE